jgi:hypothetical protein
MSSDLTASIEYDYQDKNDNDWLSLRHCARELIAERMSEEQWKTW